MSIPSTKIEEAAVQTVCTAINSCSLLHANIKKSERDIIWDGEIEIFNNGEQKKDHLTGCIPVQVKGKLVKKFSDNTRSYPLNVTDLKKYTLKIGVIFFVVEIDEKSISLCRLYYKRLLPVDIKKLIGKLNENQKQINICLKYVPENKSSSFTYICADTYKNMEMQKNDIYIDFKDIEKVNKIEIGVTSYEMGSIINVFDDENYLYGKLNPESPFVPFNRTIQINEIVKEISRNVNVEGIEYYSSYRVAKNKDNEKIQVGQAIELLKINGKEIKVDYKIIGSLKERIKDIRFLIAVFSKKIIEIDETPLYSNVTNIDFRDNKGLEELEELLSNYTMAENILNNLGINYDKNFDDLIKPNSNNLTWLINSLNKIIIPNGIQLQVGITCIMIGPLSIALLVIPKDNGAFEILNYFEKNDDLMVIAKFTNGEEAIVSPYIQLKSEDILRFSNIKCDVIYDSIISMELNEQTFSLLTEFLIQILIAYDKDTTRGKLLILAEKIQNYLDNYSIDSTINLINTMQIKKRQTPLSKEEKIQLNDKKAKLNSDEDVLALCSISILLDNVFDYHMYFEKLDPSDQDIFRSWPIYKLKPDK